MIISASRRTDIPAFYSKWFMDNIRAGLCEVPNPYNAKQISRISLQPRDVDVIVFWTRYARPLFSYLDELDDKGYRYYFQYTLVDYPEVLEPNAIALQKALDTFRQLSHRLGPKRVIWRYDPVVFGKGLDAEYHLEKFHHIANCLQGYTQRVMVSVVDLYPKVKNRLKRLSELRITDQSGVTRESLVKLMESLRKTAVSNGMELYICAQDLQLEPHGIKPGKCIDDELIRDLFAIDISSKKDPSQRKTCRCIVSKDIGRYNSCKFGCRYCYASN